MSYKIILFFITSNLFAIENTLLDLEKEKNGLINKYYERIDIARQDNLEDRVILLDRTLNCFIDSKSKRDILNCKSDERKRIMDIVSGKNY
jgi:hypothetical protein